MRGVLTALRGTTEERADDEGTHEHEEQTEDLFSEEEEAGEEED